ncbi:hypothetical protein H6F88_29475 [Oculatella sp. FACHB-28]|uniref:ribbon-helix-helix domain-containing protein n=1 Tax=Cyanophyceae TaxID=3028117 RepID=UPI001681CF24|nr:MULTISPECIES: ribbon-helix-helix domain-containing protein [Cyanophyceae]MBD2060075.1 hypothetical protein [Oculatella sp. FACHB-28]MBD2066758.1 hypothetical protein [Leptolyngbya sp. FACHB-671]
MTTNESSVSLSIPDELQQALEKYRQENRIESTSDAIRDVLQKFFEGKSNIPTYASVKQVEALENWVKNLAEQVTAINQSVKYLSVTRSIASSVIPLNSVDLEEDEIEDEPDEILFDFLPDADRY